MFDVLPMTAQEIIRRLRKLARKRGVELVLASGRGDHVKVQFGSRRSVLPGKRGELPIGTLRAVCRDLGIDHKDL